MTLGPRGRGAASGSSCFAVLALLAVQAAAAADCASISLDKLPAVSVDDTAIVAAGGFVTGTSSADAGFGSLPAFCRVVATARPVPDSQIGIEIWLPIDAWNGKLLGVGNGAWAGSISYPALAGALQRGYAAASTDTGHVGNNAEFAIGHPEKVVDFGHRAVHEMTGAAKAAIAEFYDAPPRRAYFDGCSTGGRQALSEAQRYPGDYDGIVAGAPASYVSHLQGSQIWTANIAYREPGAALDAAQLPTIHNAVMAACDALDGVADGVLENPLHCPFDATVLICRDAQSPLTGECLSPPQAATVNLKYRGPADRTGNVLYPGAARGSELTWADWLGPDPLGLAVDVYRTLVFGDADWNHREFEFAEDTRLAESRIGPFMNSTDPNLEPFFSRGGKLILYHGWNDSLVPPQYTIDYAESVIDTVGDEARDSMRLFLVPGMNHCRGGVGTDTFDRIETLDQWVRTGAPPESISAARIRAGRTERTRPLCAYPLQAVYAGAGDSDDESNFACKLP